MKREDSSKIIAFRPRIKKPPQDSRKETDIEYEETLRVPQWIRVTVYLVFSVIIGVFLFAPFFTQGKSDPVHLLLCLVFAVIALVVHVFLTLKIRMNAEGIRFGFYIFNKQIDYENIIDCSVVRYNIMDYLGWGVRKGREGATMYNIPGDQQIAVKLIVRDEEDGRAEYAFSAKRPQVICKKLQAHLYQKSKTADPAKNKEGGLSSNNY